MGEDKLREIRERVEAASSGHWDQGGGTPTEIWRIHENGDVGGIIVRAAHERDARFIAHAPADVLYLLSLVESLRVSLARTEGECEALRKVVDDLKDEIRACGRH